MNDFRESNTQVKEDPSLIPPFYINDIAVYPAENTLICNGVKTEVAPRIIVILCYLAARKNTLVSYQQLLDDIWLGRGSEGSLYQQITKLRRALGDDPSNPTFIKTVSRQGYYLIARIVPIDLAITPKDSGSLTPNWAASLASVSRNMVRFLFKYKTCGGLLAIVAAIMLVAFWGSASEEKWLALLKKPKNIVALEVPALYGGTAAHEYDVIIQRVLQWHLESNPNMHVALIPALRDKAAYQALVSHYSDMGQFKYLLRPKMEQLDGRISVRLDIENIQTMQRDSIINEVFGSADFYMLLPRIEKQVLKELKSHHLLGASAQAQFVEDRELSEALVAAVDSMTVRAPASEVLSDGIQHSWQALRLAPNNGVVSSLLLDQLKIFLSIYDAQIDVSWALDNLNEAAELTLKNNSDDFRAQHAKAVYHCSMDNDQKCRKWLKDSLRSRPYYADSLWSVNRFFAPSVEVYLELSHANYRLNPFYSYLTAVGLNLYPYQLQHSYLQQANLRAAADMIDQHALLAPIVTDWYFIANKSTVFEDLDAFSDWYLDNNLVTKTELLFNNQNKSKNATKSTKSSRYIGYQLLSANQPDLAEYWADYGREPSNYYFDVVTIKLLANLWRGEWNDNEWLAAMAVVEERRSYQNIQDKLRIFYFNYQSGYYQKAKQYLLEVFPNFESLNIDINPENFRYAVYYAELLKKSGDFKRASELTQNVNRFLERSPKFTRDVYFGIADVEYYSLNGRHELALQRLNEAIQQQWLPNAMWLWPNLENNIFLQSLRDQPQFNILVQQMNRRIGALCFENSCEANH